MTNLYYAAYAKDLDKMKTYIEQGFDINEIVSGDRPLHKAVRSGGLDAIQLLLDNGAYVDGMCNCNHTPLGLAVIQGRAEAVKLLLKHGVIAVDAKNSIGNKFIIVGKHMLYAHEKRHAEVLEILKQHGAKLCQ